MEILSKDAKLSRKLNTAMRAGTMEIFATIEEANEFASAKRNGWVFIRRTREFVQFEGRTAIATYKN
jgi:hypothetical protein